MDSIISTAWTAVPGLPDVRIYPIIRKPSCTCCNTYILATPRLIIILDPGADPEQVAHVRQTVLPLLEKRAVPVYIFLTHCHIDHYLAVTGLMGGDLDGRLVLHEKAAAAIKGRDEQVTLADMCGAILPECKVFATIFDAPGGPATEPHPLALPVLSFPATEKDVVEIFHTPGHSPDGLSYRIGPFLFTGDLHVATQAGIAGKAGWDNVALASSLAGIMREARRKGVELVIPGHGRPFPIDKAEKIFDTVREEALQLSGIALLDRARAQGLSKYALVLLEEAEQLFSIIAARLLKVAHYLEMLEEGERAHDLLRLIDCDAIEQLIDEFYYFSQELKEKPGAPLIAKAVQFARKVDRIFVTEKVSHLFDRSLMGRAKSLLCDFTNMVHGIQFRDQETLFDMNLALERLLASLKELPYDPESIFESIDDDDAYVYELARRISYQPLFASMKFYFSPSKRPALVHADRELFEDMVTALLEQSVVSEWRNLRLQSERLQDKVFLRVSPEEGNGGHLQVRDSRLDYICHSMRTAGGDFSVVVEDGVDIFLYELPAASG